MCMVFFLSSLHGSQLTCFADQALKMFLVWGSLLSYSISNLLVGFAKAYETPFLGNAVRHYRRMLLTSDKTS